jgi:hypothetical protein
MINENDYLEFKLYFSKICFDRGAVVQEVKAKIYFDNLIKFYNINEIKKGIEYFLVFSHRISDEFGQTKKFPTTSDISRAIDEVIYGDAEEDAVAAFEHVSELIRRGRRVSDYDDINKIVRSMGGWTHLGKRLGQETYDYLQRKFIDIYMSNHKSQAIKNFNKSQDATLPEGKKQELLTDETI